MKQPCAALGILHACGFPKSPKYTLWIKLAFCPSKACPSVRNLLRLRSCRWNPRPASPQLESHLRFSVAQLSMCSAPQPQRAVYSVKVLCNLFKIIHLSQIKGPLMVLPPPPPPAGLRARTPLDSGLCWSQLKRLTKVIQAY